MEASQFRDRSVTEYHTVPMAVASRKGNRSLTRVFSYYDLEAMDFSVDPVQSVPREFLAVILAGFGNE